MCVCVRRGMGGWGGSGRSLLLTKNSVYSYHMLCVKCNLQPKLVLTVVKQLSARVMGTFSCGVTTLAWALSSYYNKNR